MSERIKQGASYATVGVICAILGAILSLRIYAGIPERLEDLKVTTDKRITELATRVQANEDRLAADMRHIHSSLAEIKTLIRLNGND